MLVQRMPAQTWVSSQTLPIDYDSSSKYIRAYNLSFSDDESRTYRDLSRALPDTNNFRFDFTAFLELLKIPSLRYLFLQGFIGVVPWQVITFWSFRYLETERNYSAETISSILIPAVLMVAVGYFMGGILGDTAYKVNNRGRLFVSVFGILMGAVFLFIAL